MDEFTLEVVQSAMNVVEMCAERDGRTLDFTEASLAIIEDVLEEVAGYFADFTPQEQDNAVQQFGCYILEVGRREFGGKYAWFEKRGQPVLVVGEPEFHVAMMTWDKVRGRLSGDPADDIPFFYAGFAERARKAEPGAHVLYV